MKSGCGRYEPSWREEAGGESRAEVRLPLLAVVCFAGTFVEVNQPACPWSWSLLLRERMLVEARTEEPAGTRYGSRSDCQQRARGYKQAERGRRLAGLRGY